MFCIQPWFLLFVSVSTWFSSFDYIQFFIRVRSILHSILFSSVQFSLRLRLIHFDSVLTTLHTITLRNHYHNINIQSNWLSGHETRVQQKEAKWWPPSQPQNSQQWVSNATCYFTYRKKVWLKNLPQYQRNCIDCFTDKFLTPY